MQDGHDIDVVLMAIAEFPSLDKIGQIFSA